MSTTNSNDYKIPDIIKTVMIATNNITEDRKVDKDLPAELQNEPGISLPDQSRDRVLTNFTDSPSLNISDNKDARKWRDVVKDGQDMYSFANAYQDTLTDPSSTWSNDVSWDGTDINIRYPKLKQVENQRISGENAVFRLLAHLQLGDKCQTTLWHSGFSVTFKPPSEEAILDYYRVINSDKIKLGRSTYGLVFSNTLSYTVARLMDFAIAHIYDMNVKSEFINETNIKEHLSTLDIPLFLQGFAATMYPTGFKYSRGCTASPGKCTEVHSGLINIDKLLWVNKSALTPWQRTFMAARASKVADLQSIKRYKEELVRLNEKVLVLNAGTKSEIKITIHTPSVDAYINSGYMWIENITETIQSTLSEESIDVKNKQITKYGQASAMRQYAHWVKSIECDTNVIDDEETINAALAALSNDDNVRSEFVKAIKDYINKATIALVGIPVYKCPKCNENEPTNHEVPNATNIIPIDCISVFFGLLDMKITKLVER